MADVLATPKLGEGGSSCKDIEGLQPTRLPLQVTQMTWIIEASFSFW